MEPLQRKFDLVMSTVPAEEVVKDENNRKFWNPIVNHTMRKLDKEDRDARTARYLFTKKLL